MRLGVVEVIGRDFAIGWAVLNGDQPAHVYALSESRVIGFARADLHREDLDMLPASGQLGARAFVLLFDQPVDPADLGRVELHVLHADEPLDVKPSLMRDVWPPRQVFVLGSPRSGTSELAASLTSLLDLRWTGEGHVAARFAAAAEALGGEAGSDLDMVRFLHDQDFRQIAFEAARRTYYFIHSSASFLDKTPGTAMIRAAPFLAELFPHARFIYLRRNGIANVLSREAKFGGAFDEHCADWAAALDAWAEIRPSLPHFLEITQEDMMVSPGVVAEAVAAYLETPELAPRLAANLAGGARERTGAGLGKTLLAETGWNDEQKRIFRELCGPTMERFGYPME